MNGIPMRQSVEIAAIAAASEKPDTLIQKTIPSSRMIRKRPRPVESNHAVSM